MACTKQRTDLHSDKKAHYVLPITRFHTYYRLAKRSTSVILGIALTLVISPCGGSSNSEALLSERQTIYANNKQGIEENGGAIG